MITSVNLCGTPFQSNTDSTRLQMASKQIQQTITHLNCDIPYVIDENYDKITKYYISQDHYKIQTNDTRLIDNNKLIKCYVSQQKGIY